MSRDPQAVKVEHVDGSTSWAVPNAKHPAVYSDAIVDEMAGVLGSLDWPGARVLDPFAGKGVKLGEIEARVVASGRKIRATGVELEPEWAACAPFGRVLVGDSTRLPARWSRRFGAVVVSPCYGNRFADHHDNRDACKKCGGAGSIPTGIRTSTGPSAIVCPKCKGSKLSSRRSYTHDLGRKLTDGNAGVMHYGPEYRELHRAVWREVERVLTPGGLFLLNVKDFYRDRRRVRVSEWHRRTVLGLGFEQVETILIPLGGLRHGANRERVSNELLYVFRKAA